MKYDVPETARWIISRPPRGGRGLKSVVRCRDCINAESPPSRGAWIEICVLLDKFGFHVVAPLAGGVD